MNRLTFSGKSHAKGRNGYFWLHYAEVWGCFSDQQPIRVDMGSKREGNAPPMRLSLTIEDATLLRDFLTARLDQIAGESLSACRIQGEEVNGTTKASGGAQSTPARFAPTAGATKGLSAPPSGSKGH